MVPIPKETKQWTLQNKPSSLPVLEGDNATFKLESKPLDDLKDNQVLLKLRYLSNDPAQRGWIASNADPERLYVPPVEVGEKMRAGALAEVVASKAANLKEGQMVSAYCGWTEYAVVDAKEVQPLEEVEGLHVTHFLGALGGTGLTASYGLLDVVGCKKDDVVVVSGAGGATGSMVVQIAKKIVGCKKVIGMAGTESKCRWVEDLGADVCVNYKSKSFEDDLKKALKGGGGADVYFDNVGGGILDLMLGNMRRYGRIAACGAISSYNHEEPTVLKNYFNVITQRIEIKGFIILDLFAKGKMLEARKTLVDAYKDGKLKIGDENETVVDTKFESIPKTWLKLFEGGNTGKLVTKLV